MFGSPSQLRMTKLTAGDFKKSFFFTIFYRYIFLFIFQLHKIVKFIAFLYPDVNNPLSESSVEPESSTSVFFSLFIFPFRPERVIVQRGIEYVDGTHVSSRGWLLRPSWYPRTTLHRLKRCQLFRSRHFR